MISESTGGNSVISIEYRGMSVKFTQLLSRRPLLKPQNPQNPRNKARQHQSLSLVNQSLFGCLCALTGLKMNNLKLSREITSSLQLQAEDEAIRFAAFDIERNRLFFASSANFIYTTQLPSSQVSPLLRISICYYDFCE